MVFFKQITVGFRRSLVTKKCLVDLVLVEEAGKLIVKFVVISNSPILTKDDSLIILPL